MSDGGANPYVAVATVLEAARLGVIDRLAPGSPEDLDGIEHVRAERHTPPTLTRALDRLEKDRPSSKCLTRFSWKPFWSSRETRQNG